MSADAENAKGESIAISKFWEEELKSMPYLSCKYNLFVTWPQFILWIAEKSGKTLYLLKEGSKKINGAKKRKKVEILGTFTEYKDSKKKALQGQQTNQSNQIFNGSP